MSCSLVLRLVALVSVFALVAEGRRHMVDDDGSDGNIVSCKDSCEVCATGLKADDRVLASEFKSCNECGGVRWTVECTRSGLRLGIWYTSTDRTLLWPIAMKTCY